MKRVLFWFVILFSFSPTLKAQWKVGAGAGVALPITGYEEVLKSGWLLNGEGKYRFGSGNFAVGMKTHFTRLQKDKNPADTFQNARMTIAPILFTAEYSIPVKGSIQPYITGGLGLTLFSLNYDTSPTTGTSVFNVSFTMMPLVGVRYALSQNVYPFIESGLVLLADGPPIGFPKGEKMTGYNSIIAGIQYRFK
jgi:opacity protein-like surface antigen